VPKWTLETVDVRVDSDPDRSGSIAIGTLVIAWAIVESEAGEIGC
jgi:hypothetical protein